MNLPCWFFPTGPERRTNHPIHPSLVLHQKWNKLKYVMDVACSHFFLCCSRVNGQLIRVPLLSWTAQYTFSSSMAHATHCSQSILQSRMVVQATTSVRGTFLRTLLPMLRAISRPVSSTMGSASSNTCSRFELKNRRASFTENQEKNWVLLLGKLRLFHRKEQFSHYNATYCTYLSLAYERFRLWIKSEGNDFRKFEEHILFAE